MMISGIRSFLICALISLGTPLCFSKTLDRIVAIVEDTAILQSDVDNLYSSLQKSSTLVQMLNLQQKNLNKESVLNKLIEEKIIRHALKLSSASIKTEELDSEIQNTLKISRQPLSLFKSTLKRNNISFSSYKRGLRMQMERRKIFEREVRKNLSAYSDEDLKQAYSQKAPKEHQVGMIVADKKTLKKLQSLHSQLQNKQKALSSLSENALYQDLGWLQFQSLTPLFAKSLKGLKPGEFSQIIQDQDRYLFFAVHKERSGTPENFEMYKEQIRNQLLAQESELRFKNWIEKKKKEFQIIKNS